MPADVNAVTPFSTSMAYLQRIFSMSSTGADGRFRSTAPAEEANASIHDAWPCGLQFHVFAAATAVRCKMIRRTSTRQKSKRHVRYDHDAIHRNQGLRRRQDLGHGA